MKREISPIVQEDRKPEKIRRALGVGAGGVLVDNPVPPSVQREWQIALADNNNLLFRMAETPPVLEVPIEAPGLCRWTYEEAGFLETQRWLRDEFEWASSSGLCRSPANPQGKHGFVRLWVNQGQHLPWHIDAVRSRIFPDVHIHIAGEGLKLASPRKPLELMFSDNRTSPYLQLPNLSLVETGSNDPYKAMQKKLKQYLQERDVQLLKMQPGQALFFNEKCLHASAGSSNLRLRAGIF